MTPDNGMTVSPNFNMNLPQVPHSSDKKNDEVIQVPTNLSTAEKGNTLEKENEGLQVDHASRLCQSTTSKEITTIWQELAYTYFCQKLYSEEWKKCIDLWLEFEKKK